MPMFNNSTVSRAGNARIAVIGCSYEAFNGLSTIGANSYSYHQTGYVNWANIALGGVLRVDNYGVGGETTAAVHARVAGILAVTTASFVLVAGGMENDAQDAGLTTKPLAIARAVSDFGILLQDYAAVLSAGRQLITRTCAPRGPGASPTAYTRTYQHTISALIREWSVSHCVPCLDLHAILTDPSTGNGIASGAYGYNDSAISTSDNTHMTFTGTANAGAELARLLAPLLPLSVTAFAGGPEDVYDATNAPYGNLVANGKWLGTSGTLAGGVTGSLATSWAVSGGSIVTPAGGAVTVSKVNDRRPRSRGEWQQMSMTGTTRGQCAVNQSGTIPAGLIGKTLYMSTEAQFDAANWGGASGAIGTIPSLSLAIYDAGFAHLLATYSIFGTQPGADSTVVPPDGVLFMDGILIPTSAVYWILTVNLFGVGVMRYGNTQLRPAYP